ncbi:MAG: NupC/NupG family nucleoside CNT transporter [Polyangiales bacterium]
MVARATSLLGLLTLLLLAWLLSGRKRPVAWRTVLLGVTLQGLLGVTVLHTRVGAWLFRAAGHAVTALLRYAADGTRFVFGTALTAEFSVALGVLPVIVFFSALSSLLFHLGLLQRLVALVAWGMRRSLRTTGPETLASAANIFLGMTEAPLLIRPYLPTLTQSELFTVMVAGFGSVAGSVLGAYVGLLHNVFPDIAGHLLTASVMNAPAALVVAKLMAPPATGQHVDSRTDKPPPHAASCIDAAAQGALDGLKLALNVGAMLVAFIALVALIDGLLTWPWQLYRWLGGASEAPWTLRGILGVLLWPLAWLLGIAPGECDTVAELLGEKIALNEFIAYQHLGHLLTEPGRLSPRSARIASYALCGFANFASIAIQIGGIGGMVPERREELATLSLKAMTGGVLVTCLSATWIGLLAD